MPEPTATPTPTPVPVDNIVGRWVANYSSGWDRYNYIEFFENGTLKYVEAGFLFTGVWNKIDDRHYTMNYNRDGDVNIVLNDTLNMFQLATYPVVHIKETTPSPASTP
jgi:4-hydroxyphenylpyruvate dioxygenase-like putative hemolysin